MWRLTEGIIISLPALLLHVNDTDVGQPHQAARPYPLSRQSTLPGKQVRPRR